MRDSSDSAEYSPATADQQSRSRPRTYVNPVLNCDFPDPSVLRTSDGIYYVYGTQTLRGGRMINFQVARSPDLVNWEHLGDALPHKPVWASETQDFWAPHVCAADGRYFLYFSASPDGAIEEGERRMCIGVATAERPEGPFIDVGEPLVCGPGYADIDPVTFEDPASGKTLLYWGSDSTPIRVRELAHDRTRFADGSETVELIHPVDEDSPEGFQHLVEAPLVLRHGGWYYLFYSGDDCCGPNAHYAVMVARSRSATGPFEPQPESDGSPARIILGSCERWDAPGHCAITQDVAGDHWIVYHAIDTGDPQAKGRDRMHSRRVLLIDRLHWNDGWPCVRGDSPSHDEQVAPATSAD